MPIIPDELLQPSDKAPPVAGLEMAQKLINAFTNGATQYADIIESFESLKLYCADNALGIADPPVLTADTNRNRESVRGWVASCRDTLKPVVQALRDTETTANAVNAGRERYLALTGKGFAYRLSESDFTEVQNLINRLRDVLKTTTAISDEHRQRVLERLEAFQRELNRTTTSYDKAMAFMVEMSIVLTKAGDAAKEIRGITENIFKTLCLAMFAAHQLPSILPPPIDFEVKPLPSDSTPPKEV